MNNEWNLNLNNFFHHQIPYCIKNENFYPIYINKIQTTISTPGDFEAPVQAGHIIDESELEISLKSSHIRNIHAKLELHSIVAFVLDFKSKIE